MGTPRRFPNPPALRGYDKDCDAGEVAERFKAVVLKTTVRKHRGFESLPLLS